MDRRLVPILLITFVNSLGFSILLPIAPYIVEKFGGNAILYGVILSAYSFFQFIASPFLGSLSDKYGRKPILIISHIGTLLSWVIFGLAFVLPQYYLLGINTALWILIISRVCDGITGGNVSVATAYIADITDQKNKTKAYGLESAFWALGFILGPVIGAYSSTHLGIGYLGTVLIAFSISTITLICMIYFLPESNLNLNKYLNISFKSQLKSLFDFIFKILNYKESRVIKESFYQRFAVALVYTIFGTIFSLYLKEQFTFAANDVALTFLAIGLFMIFNQIYVIPMLFKYLGDQKSLMLSLFFIIFFSIFISFEKNLLQFIFLLFGLNLGFSINLTMLKAYILKNAPQKIQGQIAGIDESIMSFNQAFVPFLSALLYANFGTKIFLLAPLPIIAFIVYRWLTVNKVEP